MKQVFFMLMFLTSFLCWGQTTTKVDGILYLIENTSASVARQDKGLSGDIVIPESIEYNGETLSVNSIVDPTNETRWTDNSYTCEGGAFQNCQISSIQLPSSINIIPSGTFYDCSSLQSVVLPSSIESIGEGCFAHCSNLSNINLPSAITSIPRFAFGMCSSLKSISLPSETLYLGEGAFKNSGIETIDLPKSILSIGEEALAYSKLKSVCVHFYDLSPINCSKIAFNGLSDCELLIPRGTFELYTNEEPWSNFPIIKEFEDEGGIVVPSDNVNIIYDGVRYVLSLESHCAQISRQNGNLEGEVKIPDSVIYDDSAYPVTSIIQPTDMTAYTGGSVKCVGGAFQGCKITSIELPSTLNIISAGAFQDCHLLENVILPSNLEIIEVAAFAGCQSLKGLELPQSLRELGSSSFGYGYKSYVFGECLNLESIIIPNLITKIGSGCFMGSGIKRLELSQNIKLLDEYSLKANELEEIILHVQDVRDIEYSESSFGKVSDCKLYVPIGSKLLYQEFYPWIDFASIDEIDDGQGEFIPDIKIAHINSVRYILSPNGTAIVARQNKDLDGEIHIPEIIEYESTNYSVTGIVEPTEIVAWSSNQVTTEGGAFQDCLIESITLPDGIITIPAGTFANCKILKNVTLPPSITSLGAASFSGCSEIEEMFIPESVIDFGSQTPYGFNSYVFGECTSLKKINLPKGINKIPEACFKNSGLNTFLISENIKQLEEDCFTLPNLVYVKIEHENLQSLTYTESIFPSSISNVLLLVPEGSRELYENFYPWKNFLAIEEYANTNDEHQYNAYGVETEIEIEEATPTRSLQPSQALDGSDVTKDYIPSGKTIDHLEAPQIDGLIFVRWENVPEYMPSSDIRLKAIYKMSDEVSVDGIQADETLKIEQIFDTKGQPYGKNLIDLDKGTYIIKFQNGETKKIAIR